MISRRGNRSLVTHFVLSHLCLEFSFSFHEQTGSMTSPVSLDGSLDGSSPRSRDKADSQTVAGSSTTDWVDIHHSSADRIHRRRDSSSTHGHGLAHARVRLACFYCRLKRIKCSGRQPVCEVSTVRP